MSQAPGDAPPAPSPSPDGVASAAATASARVEALHERGVRAWPGVELSLGRFARHLARTAQPAHGRAPGALAAEDLFLAAACLERCPGAFELLDSTYLLPLARALRRSGLPSDAVDECVQELRGRLVCGDGRRQPLLAAYSGRGGLKSWLSVTATRELVARGARKGREHELDASGPEPALALRAEPELALLGHQVQAAFPEAFRAGLAALSPRQRNLLRYAYRERLSIDRLGALYGVHRATAARWLEGARGALAEGVRAQLGSRLGVAVSELGSVLRLVVSTLEASLPERLEATSPQGRGALALLALVLALFAAPALASGPPPSRLRVGLSLPTQREERWVRDREVMEFEAKRLGLDLRVRVSDNDPALQEAQCDELLDEGVRALVLAPHDATRAAAIVGRARRAGVEVLSYDRLVTGAPQRYLYVGFDGVAVGALQAEYLVTTVPRGHYVLLAGPESDHNARLYREGALRVLGPRLREGAIRLVLEASVPDWRPTEAQRLIERELRTPGARLDAVLAPNDATAGGVITALTSVGRAGKVIVTGQDADLAAAIRIVRGKQAMSVFKDTRLLGRAALEAARELLLGQRVATGGRTVHNGLREVPAILLTPYTITRENLDAMLIDSGYLDRAQVYR